MSGFAKLFSTILNSTIWGEPDHVRLVWITMLALADRFGRVHASVPGIAHQARVTIDQARSAIKVLEEPDPDSRTPDFDGRRIARMEGGWRLLNYVKYRETKDEEAQRERNAIRQARHREKVRNAKRNALSRDVTQNNPIAEAEADTEETTGVTCDVFPEMIAAAVKQELSLSGVPVMICLTEICKAKLEAGADATQLRNSLIESWIAYKAATEKLEWTYGSPEKFYASDRWQDSKLWPWKNGTHSIRKLKAVSE